MDSKTSKKPTIKTIHKFKKSIYFIPSLLFKYPSSDFLKGTIETIPTKLKLEKNKLTIEKFKRAKLRLQNEGFTKEKFIFDFNKKKIDYFESDIPKIHFEIIKYDFEECFYEKKTWINSKFKFFYKAADKWGNWRLNKLIETFEKNKNLVQEYIHLDIFLEKKNLLKEKIILESKNLFEDSLFEN